jgi:hypothetical protein
MGLMMMDFDPEKVKLSSREWFIEKEEDNRIERVCLPHAGFPELGQDFVQVQGGFFGQLEE